jgi:hypothetical protein
MKFVFYSHFDYSDIWPVLFGQCEKYLGDQKKVLFTNKGTAPDGWEVITYDDSLPYQQRVTSCLNKLETNHLVFSHEDMFLYDVPDLSKLKEFQKVLGNVNFIKLLRGGYVDELIDAPEHEDLLVAPLDMVFTIQPTLCSKSDLIKMYDQTPGDSIWEFESNTKNTSLIHGMSGRMVYKKGDKKRGMYHYDSCIYPYIATAVVKGKWYTSDYPELLSILADYNINVNQRGEA